MKIKKFFLTLLLASLTIFQNALIHAGELDKTNQQPTASVGQQAVDFTNHPINPNTEQEAQQAAQTYQNISQTIKENPNQVTAPTLKDTVGSIGFFGMLKSFLLELKFMQQKLIETVTGKHEQTEQEKLDAMIINMQQQQSHLSNISTYSTNNNQSTTMHIYSDDK